MNHNRNYKRILSVISSLNFSTITTILPLMNNQIMVPNYM